ncbi:MAG: MlaD family protein [Candidatus Babeliales bacterium]
MIAEIKTETRVGLFVLGAIGIFFYMSFQIGVFRWGVFDYRKYKVYFKDISGLTKKSDVKISGVKVGWVEHVELIPDHELQAEAVIMVHKRYILHTNAWAEIRQDGLLGNMFLELNPGSLSLPPLLPGSALGEPGKAPVPIGELIQKFSDIADDVKAVTTTLEGVLAGEENQEKFKNLRDNLSSAVSNINSVAQKLDEGEGLIGKLINDDETYDSLKSAVEGFSHQVSIFDNMGVVVDGYSMSMHRPAENYRFEDAKGFVNVRLHPSEDFYYLLGLVGSNKGSIERRIYDTEWFNPSCDELDPAELKTDLDKHLFAPRRREVLRKRDTVKFNAQFGKIYSNLSFRVGLFENFFGAAVDYDIPFNNPNFRWVMTLEAYDLRGRDRFNDDRPHLTWLNRVFLFKNIYFTFGADDFVSKHNANAFVGVGLRFDDDYLKYLLAHLPSLSFNASLQ